LHSHLTKLGKPRQATHWLTPAKPLVKPRSGGRSHNPSVVNQQDHVAAQANLRSRLYWSHNPQRFQDCEYQLQAQCSMSFCNARKKIFYKKMQKHY
jgi:hypothetical protein